MNRSIQTPAPGEQRLQEYLSRLATVLGHADRRARLVGYCTGLLLPGERKSVEPIAARLDPANVPRLHQALHHFVASAAWNDSDLLAAVREQVLPALTRHGPMTAWILDDTAFPKKGTHSVGVTRQYCGQLGKRENCQVAVSLSLANDHGSLPIAFDLYLPEDWADDPLRRAKAGVPQDLVFRTKPQIAEQQIRRALADGVPPGVILGDAGYGIDTNFRTALTGLSLRYVLGVQSSLGIWPPGSGPLPPEPWSGKGRPPKLQRRKAEHQPMNAKQLAIALPPEAWQMVSWREGSQGELQGRFAAVRVRPSHRDYWRAEPHPVEWLLIEWPEREKEPSKYWLSTLPETTALVDLVHLAKLRWRIERDYQELKQELGLDHYEGRGWRGFHHHASLCIAAYGFLIRERSLFPPDDQGRWQAAALPEGWRPRGRGRRGHADPARAS
jgi:SRSO17 transposase